MRTVTKSEKETLALGKKLAHGLRGGEILLLEGELGSGKTTFVRGLTAGLGISERIKSPTFVLMRQHRIKNEELRMKNFVHVDAYRIKSADELIDIGLLDWFGRPDTLVAVEWGEKIKPLLKGKKFKVIKFQHGKKENERFIVIPSLRRVNDSSGALVLPRAAPHPFFMYTKHWCSEEAVQNRTSTLRSLF